MSRVATPQTTQPTATRIAQEKIAQRAYEKWLKRGCCHGSDVQDWIEAEAELKAEMSRPGGSNQYGHQRR